MAARPAPSTLIDEIVEVFDPLAARLHGNLSRVRHLLAIYKLLYGRGKGRRTVHKTDLLRAAVVFLHATLEDCLRSVARAYLPKTGVETINKIPLAGSRSIRAEKFPLGRLVEHRGKTVDDLINESITQHLERCSFNDTTDISRLLESLDFLSEGIQRTLPTLQGLMSRRHQIVHQADRSDVTGRGRQRAASISVKSVERWSTAVTTFGHVLIAHVIDKEFRAKFLDGGGDPEQLDAVITSHEDEVITALKRKRRVRR